MGGAILMTFVNDWEVCEIKIYDSLFEGNTANSGAGAIFVDGSFAATLHRLVELCTSSAAAGGASPQTRLSPAVSPTAMMAPRAT
jgi:hypothetical protein